MFNSSFFFLSKYKEKGKGENYIKLKKKKKNTHPHKIWVGQPKKGPNTIIIVLKNPKIY
jgi:hypothetical protein